MFVSQEHQTIKPVVKYGGGSIMTWASSCTTWHHSQIHNDILADDVGSAACQIKLQDDNRQHRCSKEWIQKEKISFWSGPIRAQSFNSVATLKYPPNAALKRGLFLYFSNPESESVCLLPLCLLGFTAFLFHQCCECLIDMTNKDIFFLNVSHHHTQIVFACYCD